VLEELERRTDTHRELAALSESEAEAVRDAVRDEFRRFDRRGVLRDVVIFLLGALITFGITEFRG
jgi:hypothetical protein